MGYTLNVSGHVVRETEDEARAVEAGIERKAREFVAELDGVASAYGHFQLLGSRSLTEPKPEPAPAAEPAPPVSEGDAA